MKAHMNEKFARYVPAKDVYDPPTRILNYVSAQIKKPNG